MDLKNRIKKLAADLGMRSQVGLKLRNEGVWTLTNSVGERKTLPRSVRVDSEEHAVTVAEDAVSGSKFNPHNR